MGRTHVVFNGFDLTRHFVVSNLQDPLLPRKIDSREVSGSDGSIFVGVSLAPKAITMTLTVRGKAMEERRMAARMLAAILAVNEPAPLSLSADNGIYYLAIPKSDGAPTNFRNADSYDIEFYAADPVAYGVEKTVTVPSGGSVTFDVGGTYPCMPAIEAPVAKNASAGYWRLRMEDGSYLLATIPPGVSAAPVVADCEKRVLRVNGSVALLNPPARWLVFEPGQHTLAMTGAGAATIKYVERWL